MRNHAIIISHRVTIEVTPWRRNLWGARAPFVLIPAPPPEVPAQPVNSLFRSARRRTLHARARALLK